MMPFPRQPAPEFWNEKERAWLEKEPREEASVALHKRRHEGHSLAWWFHVKVRPPREPHLCAYCDGELGSTSPPTIDHFVPVSYEPSLGLCWLNLFPICATCNTTYKRDTWVPDLVRPDTDAVVGWFSIDYRGELSPNAALDEGTRARVARTIEILGLNAKPRCRARQRVFQCAQQMREALDPPPVPPRSALVTLKRLVRLLRVGPYRFIARQVCTPP